MAVDRELFKKYGLDVNMLQLRNGQVSLTEIITGKFVKTLEDTGYLPKARRKLGL